MITKEEIINIKNLSKLYLTEQEIEDFKTEMTGMINFVDQLQDLENINTDLNNNNTQNNLREDKIIESYSREKILKNVNNGKDGFFYLEKFR